MGLGRENEVPGSDVDLGRVRVDEHDQNSLDGILKG